MNGVPVPRGASVERLSDLITANGPEKWAAIAALSASDDDGSLRVLAKLVRSPDPFERRAAMEAIGRHSRGERLAGSICDGLGDASEVVVRAASAAAAALGIQAAGDGMRRLLTRGSPELRRQAVRDLAAFWRDGDFADVFPMMQGDPVEEVRLDAARTLRMRAGRSNWRALYDAWRGEHPPRHRVWACELAAKFGGPELAPDLAALAGDADGHVRRAADKAAVVLRRRGKNAID